MNNLYEALEICLQDLEKGADLESVLFRYPDLADELRPILEVSTSARSMAAPVPSPEVVRRNRSKVLQHAARMREAKAKSAGRIWFASLRRIAVTLAVVALLFLSGTSLVSASSDTIPGDNLYPVKRTWEGLQLFFTFNPLEREALELEHENRRLYELKELFKEGRSEEVDFTGYVTSQNGNEWIVSGVRVLISNQTEIRDQGIAVADAVRVRGVTQENGAVLAERIRLLSSDEKVPDVEDDHELENDNTDNSGPGSGEDGSSVEETQTPEPENDHSGNGNDSGPEDNQNDNSNADDDSNASSGGSGNDNSGGDYLSGDGNDNGGNNNSNDDSNDDSGGGNDHGNDNGDNSGEGGDRDSGDDSGGDDD